MIATTRDQLEYPDLAGWKVAAATVCAVLLFLIFLVPGLWKTLFPLEWAARLQQLQVPGFLSVPGTIALGIAELFTAVLVIVPRFRRWGAWASIALLLIFMAYVGVMYDVLQGEECSCFPWIKRSVGPAFFLSDAAMVGLAVVAGLWSRPSHGFKQAAAVLAGIAVFAGVSYGVTIARQSGIEAPASISVEGRPYSLQSGKVFLYFFNPECTHCDQAARDLSKLNWGETRVIGVPTVNPQFAGEFMSDTRLSEQWTTDSEKLREVFQFTDPPYAVLLENGRQKAAFQQFDDTEPMRTLKQMGVAE